MCVAAHANREHAEYQHTADWASPIKPIPENENANYDYEKVFRIQSTNERCVMPSACRQKDVPRSTQAA